MNKSGLLIRLAVVMIFSSLAVGFISSQLFYRLTYLNEVDNSNKQIEELHKTVSSTASISAYLLDRELAKEVVEGLATNGVVHGAIISFNDEVVSTKIIIDKNSMTFDLYSPFEEDRIVGYLKIIPDLLHIEHKAQEIGSVNAQALVAQASVVTFIAIFIAYLLITQPMLNIGKSLHRTKPGTSKRISIPDFHNSSELGDLVRDINALLNKTQQQITAEHSLRNELEVVSKRFKMLFENSSSAIVLMEPRGSIILSNLAFSSLLEDLNIDFKKNFGPLLHDLLISPDQLSNAVRIAFSNDEISSGEYQLKTPENNRNTWVYAVVNSILSDDMKEYYQLTLHDISKRKSELEKLNIRANYDQMTNLLNRHAGEKSIQELINQQASFAVILMDLNGFKKINDKYGHDSGDEILKHISDILKSSVRHNDFPCRWGGDEFVIVLKDTDKVSVKLVCEKLQTKIRHPYRLSNAKEVKIGASIGAAFHPKDSSDMQGLVQLADKAMYKAKEKKSENTNIDVIFSSDIPNKTRFK